jgi:hypothetical protein
VTKRSELKKIRRKLQEFLVDSLSLKLLIAVTGSDGQLLLTQLKLSNTARTSKVKARSKKYQTNIIFFSRAPQPREQVSATQSLQPVEVCPTSPLSVLPRLDLRAEKKGTHGSNREKVKLDAMKERSWE